MSVSSKSMQRSTLSAPENKTGTAWRAPRTNPQLPVIAGQMAQKSEAHLDHLVSANENQSDGITGGPINGAIGGMGSEFGNGKGMAQGGAQPLAINSRRVEFNVSIYAVFSIE